MNRIIDLTAANDNALAAARSTLNAIDPTGHAFDWIARLVDDAERSGRARNPERFGQLVAGYVGAWRMMTAMI
jgi:hypothetical protein